MIARSTMNTGLGALTLHRELKELYYIEKIDDMCALLLQHQECEQVHAEFFDYVVGTLGLPHTAMPGFTDEEMELIKKLVQTSDIVQRVTETMQRFLHNQGIQQSCSSFLRYAFNGSAATVEMVEPCCAEVIACMTKYPTVAKLQFTCCCVLEAAIRVCPNQGKSAYLESAINHHDTVNIVHKAIFLQQSVDDDEAMK